MLGSCARRLSEQMIDHVIRISSNLSDCVLRHNTKNSAVGLSKGEILQHNDENEQLYKVCQTKAMLSRHLFMNERP